jgi:ABC-type Fe3+-siderophore transport system permease subunit
MTAFVIVCVLIGLIGCLLVGHLAERWNRSRFNYTIGSLLLGWPLVLIYLLIVGRRYEAPRKLALSPAADRQRRREHALKRQGVKP